MLFNFDGTLTAFLITSTFFTPAAGLPTSPPTYASQAAAAVAAAYCTNSDLTYKLSTIPAPIQGNANSTYQQSFNLTIDDTTSGYKQTIDGFGAAVTDATVITFNQLSSSSLDQLLTTLMTSSGASFSLMRHTIGASDLSPDPPYTYDDNGGQGPDTALANFTLTSSGTAMANMLAKMNAKNDALTVLGSPWSAPSWMKSNRQLIGNTQGNNLQDRYLNSNETDYSNSFAQYFVNYVRAFATLGVTINAITLQNEPLNSQGGYPTMYMFDFEAGTLIKNFVGPALAAAGLSTSIWAYDHNTDVPSYPQNVLNTAGSYVNAIAWHCYAGNVDWKALSDFRTSNLNSAPNLKQYMTECWTPQTDSSTWFQAANFTIGPLQNWANGVMAWTLAANSTNGPYLSTGGCATCPGLVRINDDGTYTFNMAYYLMAQFSKFIPKGAKILSGKGYSSTSYQPGLQMVASLNPDGTRSVVMMNTLTSAVSVRLSTASGQVWSGNVPMSSVVTWVLPPVG